ncbi:MAG: lipid-A-disaccharide synthase [Candidatus Gastranaerophilales bacterium]|nr:lipid-A-disaccharide synthase [Candidatus Gastranaerophilales bacterium]
MFKKLFIITGEHSGDIHAGRVVDELRKTCPDLIIEGIGGENLKNAGAKILFNQEKMSAVGFSFKILFDHITLGKRVVDYLTKEFKPDLVLLIDYGAFNLNIAKFLKRNNKNIKIFYYIPPQIWASRRWRIKAVKKFVDKVLCIFPFEKELYEQEEITTHYCGHPLISQLPPPANRDVFFEKHGLDKNKKLVSVFPGSRTFELKNLMEIFIKSIRILKKSHSDIQFLVSHAPNLSDDVFNKYLKETEFKVIKGENQAMLSVSDALILASGTVALEAALYQTPMIISYRGPWLFYFAYLAVRCINRVCLPNIIADKDIVPELIQGRARAGLIASNIEQLLYDEEIRQKQIEGLSTVKNLLSDKISSCEAAQEISII